MRIKPWYAIVALLAIVFGWFTGSAIAVIVAAALVVGNLGFTIVKVVNPRTDIVSGIMGFLVVLDCFVNFVWMAVRHLR